MTAPGALLIALAVVLVVLAVAAYELSRPKSGKATFTPGVETRGGCRPRIGPESLLAVGPALLHYAHHTEEEPCRPYSTAPQCEPAGPEPQAGGRGAARGGCSRRAQPGCGAPCIPSAAHDGWTSLGPRPGPPWVNYDCGPPGFCSVLGPEDSAGGWARAPKAYVADTASSISHMVERSA